MTNESEDKSLVKVVKKGFDKFLRFMTGNYGETQKKEIDAIQELYNKHFGKVPETLNLGENYSNKIELSVASFKIDYWIDQLSGNFYSDAERMIDIMCSYEMQKRQNFNSGYTDDPIHLLFYDFKQYCIKLSCTQFDIEDIKEAQNWQNVLREFIINNVFVATNIDSRVQVLFDLESTMRKIVIPKLQAGNENKSALDHLKSVSAHLTKFSDIMFKYLFYIGRNSEYIPNFSIRKLRSLKKESTESSIETLGITQSEKAILDKIKDTWPVNLLYEVFAKDEKEKDKECLSIISFEKNSERYLKNFAFELIPRNKIESFLPSSSCFSSTETKSKEDFYAKGIINRQYFINAHLLLAELKRFKELFDLAKACSEMGGNLLAFGLLREQLSRDVHDCIKYIYSIKLICENLEEDAWEAFRKSAKGAAKEGSPLPDNWKSNYTKSAVSYFNSLMKSYELCQSALENLAAAAIRKSKTELVQETQRAVGQYISMHNYHVEYRAETIKKLDHLPSLNSYLFEKYESQKDTEICITGNNPKEEYKKIKELCRSKQNNFTPAIISDYFKAYKVQNNFESLYYTGRILSFLKPNEQSYNQERNFYEKAKTLSADNLKVKYRIALVDYKEEKYKDAKNKLNEVMQSYTSFGMTSSNFFKKASNYHKLSVQKDSKKEETLLLESSENDNTLLKDKDLSSKSKVINSNQNTTPTSSSSAFNKNDNPTDIENNKIRKKK